MLLYDSNAALVVAGRAWLQIHLQRRKALVVVDGIDTADQLMNLLPPCELHPESLVIVTSRNKSVLLARCKRESVREVQLLPEGHDTQLFEAWAFAEGRPLWATPVLVRELVACCGQLPLTLKVCLSHAFMCVAEDPNMSAIKIRRDEFFSQKLRVYCMPAGLGRASVRSERTGFRARHVA